MYSGTERSIMEGIIALGDVMFPVLYKILFPPVLTSRKGTS